MRTITVFAVFYLFLICAATTNADGILIGKSDPRIDPKSHAYDITEPEQKALLIHYNGKESLILQVSYKGDVSEFAWLVPTPARPNVTKYDAPIFHWLHEATAPRIKYWFVADQKLNRQYGAQGLSASATPAPSVEVLEQKQVGVYDVAVLRARNENDLLGWLRRNNYHIDMRLGPVLADYIQRGWVFTAMRINAVNQPKIASGLREGTLQSLKFTFQSPYPVYPLKISSLGGRSKVLLYVVAGHQMEAPLFRTECSINAQSAFSFYYMLEDELRDTYQANTNYLTKLTADLKPEDMTNDIILGPAASDQLIPVRDIRPPVLENLGASFLLLGLNITQWPYPLVIFQVCFLIALTPFGRKHRIAWGIGGAVALIFLHALGSAEVVPYLADSMREGSGYWPAGVTALVLVAGIAVMIILRLRRRLAA